MLLSRAIIYQLLYLVVHATCRVVTVDAGQNALIASKPTPTLESLPTSFETHTLIAPTSREATRVDEETPTVTEPPSNRPDLQRRQPCCFDDRGFRVDCATWTGYYYTWGPQGNPYEGGPQCDGNWNGGSGGSGSGSGSNGNGQNNGNGQVAVLNASEESPRAQVAFIVGAALLLVALML